MYYVKKKVFSPVLVVLSFCGDVFSTVMRLQNPISSRPYKKSKGDGGNTDVWLYGPEHTTRWMAQKT